MLPHTTHNHPQPGVIQKTRRFGRLVLNRSGPEDYYRILETLRRETIEVKVTVVEQCFSLWIKLVTSLGKTSQGQFLQILDEKDSEYIPQVCFLLMDAIVAVDPKRQKQLWHAIGPRLERFIEQWKEHTGTV